MGSMIYTAYTIFNKSLITIYEENKLVSCKGTIYCGVPTITDDVTLISKDPYDFQTMICIQMSHEH